MENYYHDATSSSCRNSDDLKALKQELAELLEEEDAKYDKLRSLPLYIAAELPAGNTMLKNQNQQSNLLWPHYTIEIASIVGGLKLNFV
jgi:hypothetical protein